MRRDKSSSPKIQKTFYRIYSFLKGFYGLADIPTKIQEQIDTTVEHNHPAWLNDIIKVTKGNRDKHEAEVRETMNNLEHAAFKPKEV